MIPGRLSHNEPKLNDKAFWYVAIAEGPLHYLVEIHSKAGCINGQIRSALKADYHFVDEPVTEKAPRVKAQFRNLMDGGVLAEGPVQTKEDLF